MFAPFPVANLRLLAQSLAPYFYDTIWHSRVKSANLLSECYFQTIILGAGNRLLADLMRCRGISESS